MQAPSNTTGGNVARVTGYGTVSWAALFLANSRLEWNLSAEEFGACMILIPAVTALVWNFIKDQGWIKDNR